MKKDMYKRSLIGVTLVICSLSLSAQQSNVLYHMQSVPQAHYLNPAKEQRCGFYLGFPAASSIYLNYGNNSFDPFDVVFPGTGLQADSLITILHPSYDISEFISKLKVSNLQSADASASLISFGFRSGNSFVTVDLSTKAFARLSVPGDLLKLGLQGNADFLGKTANLSPFRVNATAYHELGIGISNRIGRNLSIGFRPKLLLGVANISMANPVPDIGLFTDPDNFDLRFHSRMTVNVSAPIDVHTNNEGEIDSIRFMDIDDSEIPGRILNFRNVGAGLDLGAEYKLFDRLTLSASLLDLGFISWGSDTYSFKQDGEFIFTGLDLSDGLVANSDWDLETAAEALLDSIADLFRVSHEGLGYLSFLAPKLYLAASYDLNEMIRLGVLSRTEYFGKRFRQSFSFSANAFLARFFNLSASYTIMNNSYDNLGLGMAIKGGPLQLYVITESTPFYFTKFKATDKDFKDLDGLILPSDMSSVNLRFGLNLVFGCRQKKLRDIPLVL